MGDTNLDKLKEIFKVEVDELIDSAEDVLISIEKDKENEDLMNEIFRIFHSIKGSAGVVGFEDMAFFAHGVENVLDRVRNKEVSITKGLISLILDSVDIIKDLVQFYFQETAFDEQKIDKVNSSLSRFMGVNEDISPAPIKEKSKRFRIGMSAKIVVAVVIIQGLILLSALSFLFASFTSTSFITFILPQMQTHPIINSFP